tara:strand:+ start:6813 stop:7301 length:489 start_codon:yes stop_codon:yes gene_type:complete
MALKITNNAKSTLAGSILIADTELAVAGGDAAKFPSLASGDWFPLTVVDADGNREIMRCTARAGATLTVTRGQEGTTARNFAAGSRCDLRLTAGAITAMQTDVGTLSDAITALETDVETLQTAVTTLVDETVPGLGTIVGRDLTVATTDPTGGADGDVWFKV